MEEREETGKEAMVKEDYKKASELYAVTTECPNLSLPQHYSSLGQEHTCPRDPNDDRTTE